MNDELYHYGVLGMKWGIHRSRKNAEKAKKYDKKAKQLEKEGKDEKSSIKMRNKANKARERSKYLESKHTSRTDKKTYNRVRNTSVGKLAVQSLLLGTYGSLKYNQARANNSGRAEAFVDGFASGVVNNLSFGIASVAEPRVNAHYKRKNQ